jgi:hypothetical protein
MDFFKVRDHPKKKNPQKGHHQIPTADLPTNTQSNFITNTQYVKYHT